MKRSGDAANVNRARLLLGGFALASAIAAGWFETDESFAQTSKTEPSPVLIELIARNESGVSGLARIETSGDETKIEVTVVGGADNYLPYLRRGTCDSYSAKNSIPLSISAEETPSETTVDLAFETLVASRYVIDLHVAQGSLESLMDPKTSVACGVIHAGEDPNSLQPPVAGIGSLDANRANWIVAVLVSIATMSGLTALSVRRVKRSAAAEVRSEVAFQRLRGLFP